MDAIAPLNASLADRYRIERELGAGGMATVYLAHDIKHDRKVALKVLKPELAAVLGADRFVVEIKTTASLQHPHILPLFDSGTADSFLFYVMPFIDGETLRDKLNRETQLGIEEALRITREVADALEYAHGKGIIHRDIKPENILLANGRPMVADFGIALAVSAAAGGRMTETGLSLGTPHYMSPEQATADKEITARSDIYSLASVLYEMLAGNPPHTGSSAQQIIVKIIADAARPVAELRKSVPANVAAAIAVALEKLPADRFESAKAFTDALANPAYTSASLAGSHGAAAGARGVSWRAYGLTAAALVVALGGWATSVLPSRRAQDPVAVKFAFTASEAMPLGGSLGRNLAVSPDGRTVVYATLDSSGRAHLYARAIDEVEEHPIPGTEGGSSPFFSTDGLWLGFAVDGQLKKIPVAGGTAISLAQVPSMRGASWAKRGIVVSSESRLLVVPVDGGQPVPLTPGDTTRGFWPAVLPGGDAVVYATGNDSPLAIADLNTGRTHSLGQQGGFPLGVADGELIFTGPDGTLAAVPFDARTRRVQGNARVVLANVVINTSTGETKAGLSSGGTLAYLTGAAAVDVVEADLNGRIRPLPLPSGRVNSLRYSRDGRQLAASMTTGIRTDLFVFDLASGAVRRLTSDGMTNTRPEWSPDGKRILYRTERSGGTGTLWWQAADGSGSAARVVASPGKNIWQGVLAPHDNTVVYRTGTVGDADIWYRRLAGDTAEHAVATSRFNEFTPAISPNGRWIAYYSDEFGSFEVYVRPFPGPGGQIPISVGGGQNPVWSSDGRKIFFVSGNRLTVATVEENPTLVVTQRKVLFEGNFQWGTGHRDYDVAPDGNSFVLLRPVVGTGEQIMVIHKWSATLRNATNAGGAR